MSLTIHCRSFAGCCHRHQAGHRPTRDRRLLSCLAGSSHYRKCLSAGRATLDNILSFILISVVDLSATTTTAWVEHRPSSVARTVLDINDATVVHHSRTVDHSRLTFAIIQPTRLSRTKNETWDRQKGVVRKHSNDYNSAVRADAVC